MGRQNPIDGLAGITTRQSNLEPTLLGRQPQNRFARRVAKPIQHLVPPQIGVVQRDLPHFAQKGLADQPMGGVVIQMPLFKRAHHRKIGPKRLYHRVKTRAEGGQLVADKAIHSGVEEPILLGDVQQIGGVVSLAVADRRYVGPRDSYRVTSPRKATNKPSGRQFIVRMREGK